MGENKIKKIKNQKRYYFAYGSNLNKAQMAQRCPEAKPICMAKIIDCRLIFKTYCDVLLKKPNESVYGAIYELSPECEDSLDVYEGYPHGYDKIELNAFSKGKPYKVFMYVMTSLYRDAEFPTNLYLSIVKGGYNDWKIDMAHLEKSIAHTYKDIIDNAVEDCVSTYNTKKLASRVAISTYKATLTGNIHQTAYTGEYEDIYDDYRATSKRYPSVEAYNDDYFSTRKAVTSSWAMYENGKFRGMIEG